MMANLKRLASRFEALKMRERVLIFAAVAAALVFFVDRFAFQPQTARGKTLIGHIADQNALVQSLDVQIKAMEQAQANDPDVLNRERTQRARAQISQLEIQIAALQKGLIRADRMAALLESVLGQHKGLQVVELRTLPPVSLLEHAADSVAKPGAGAETPSATQSQTPSAFPTAGATERNLYKHGFELTVRGNYPDFVRYLSQLEKLPSRMYWGKVTMDADNYPSVTLRITIYTLSLDKAWLVV